MSDDHYYRAPRGRGFTLIELSIVLVIIGLVVGSVLAGKWLIRTSELQSVSSDVHMFKAAVMTFRIKYDAFPGDMPNATDYWGTDSNCPSTTYDGVPKAATCNGDDDGRVGFTSMVESYRFWQHLANAKLIEGMYTGTAYAVGGSSSSVLGRNVPQSRINNAGYTIGYKDSSLANGSQAWLYYSGIYNQALYYGKGNPNGDTTVSPAISTADAFWLDQKVDDGLPGSGQIVTFRHGNNGNGTGYSPSCASVGTEQTASYDLAQTGTKCSLVWRNLF